ncbi:MAG: Na(+)-translocating NADH-quinone reductase subunit A [Saprospiraceae bacterium]
MINGTSKSTLLILLLALPITTFAQSGGSGGTNYFLIGVLLIAALLLIMAVLQVADSLMHIEAKKIGIDPEANGYSFFSNNSSNVMENGKEVTKLKKGFDILLEGEAAKTLEQGTANTYAIQPGNFIGMSPIPKVTVEAGDEVKAGDPIMFDKKRPDVIYCAPVSGEVVEVRRGAKRSIKEVIILADKGEMTYKSITAPDLKTVNRADLVKFLLENGAWPLINERPFDVVPDVNAVPRDIFISTFDTAPLAPDNNFVVQGQEAHFQKGLDVLKKLTPGHVYLGLNSNEDPSAAFADATGVEKRWYNGPHPAGNVGIQIHHTHPINTTDKVWTLGVQECIQIGKLFNEGHFDASRVVVIAGAELKEPKYVRTHQGACVGELLQGNMKSEKDRIVAGDVLSGEQKAAGEFLNFHDDQITVLEEGDEYEMFGWLLPLTPRPTISNTYPNALFGEMKFQANTNTHGEQRAFVVTGQYEKVLPMDIYPQHLMKAILVNDFERMEGLGIYELSEEDVALCEFVCTSKQPLQSILRDGLEIMRSQS